MTLLLGLAGLALIIGWACAPLWIDLVPTGAEVRKGTDGNFGRGIAAVTIAAAQCLYRKTDDTIALCDADGDATTSLCIGIATHGSLAGQVIEWQNGGSFTVGATAAMTVGIVYCTSDNAGGIRPSADINNGDRTTVLGVASTTAILMMPQTGVFNSQVVKA